MHKDLVGIIVRTVREKIVFEILDAVEFVGYSKATKASLDGGKLKNQGWSPKYDIKTHIERTIDMLM